MNYLEKHPLFPPLIAAPPEPGLALAVAIPCHDEPELLRTLESLAACRPGHFPAEVIVVVNSAENAPAELKKRNAASVELAQRWAAERTNAGLKFHILHFPGLPPKHAGVGLARKIAMDEAVRRLPPKGVIACLDADSLVAPNYLQALERYFERHPACPAVSIWYEHPLSGPDFPGEVYAAITRYELHLRYYALALRWAGLPTAVQTVGSAMAVRSGAYQSQGGMNRRKAGEDFYFLHKFTPLDGFDSIGSTTVFPSPRRSHRVPFGTGKAVGDMLDGRSFFTYAPAIFKDLQPFLKNIGAWHNPAYRVPALPASLMAYLEQENFMEKLRELRQHTASARAFEKRFFRWFDAFRAMQFAHFTRDNFYPSVPVELAASWLLEIPEGQANARQLLERMRQRERSFYT